MNLSKYLSGNSFLRINRSLLWWNMCQDNRIIMCHNKSCRLMINQAGLIISINNQFISFNRYHSPHWRHIRFVNNIPLVHHMEMRNDADGMGRRLDVFVNDVIITFTIQCLLIISQVWYQWKVNTEKILFIVQYK